MLTAADNTTDQVGSPVTLSERLREKLQRHDRRANALANPDRDEYIRDVARRVVNTLVELGQTDAYLDV